MYYFRAARNSEVPDVSMGGAGINYATEFATARGENVEIQGWTVDLTDGTVWYWWKKHPNKKLSKALSGKWILAYRVKSSRR